MAWHTAEVLGHMTAPRGEGRIESGLRGHARVSQAGRRKGAPGRGEAHAKAPGQVARTACQASK